MTIIDRYIMRSFIGSYLILLAVSIGLIVIVDMLTQMDEFTEDRSLGPVQIVGVMVDYYAYNLPLYFSYLSGPMMAVAAAFSIGRLLRNNELTAIVASGVPLQRLLAPLLFCVALVICAWFANREWVIPRFAPEISRSHDDMVGVPREGVYCLRDERNSLLVALEWLPAEQTLRRVFFIEADARGRHTALVEADAATWDAGAATWRLDRGRRSPLPSPDAPAGIATRVDYQPIDAFAFSLDPGELTLRRNSEWSDLMSWRQLDALRRSTNLVSRDLVEMSLHMRLTEPLTQAILVVLATVFFLTREPTNVLALGARSLLFGGGFYLTVFVAHSVARDSLPAELVAWLPLLVFGPSAAMLAANVKT